MDQQSPNDIPLNDESRYRLLVDAITDYAIYMLDPQGRVTSWNAGAQRFKGYAPHEIIGEHFSRFYTPEDRAAGMPANTLATALREGRFEKEGWRLRKDGSRFWAHVIVDPIISPAGEILGFAKITRDLTERRAAELALRRSEEQFRLLVQGVTDYAIYMLDPQGRVTNWNAGAQRIKGYAPDEIIGEHFSRFYTDEDRAAGAPQHALAVAAAEGRFEREGWRVRKDGSRFWAHVIIDSIHENGELIGFAKITRDITERRLIQQQLDEAREALFQSQKLDAIGRFTGGVAHDFNNLLMAVIGSLELVTKRTPFDPTISPLLDNAMQGARRGAALTRQMLAFARKQQLNLTAVDIPRLVAEIRPLLETSLVPAIALELNFPPDLPAVTTDAAQLENALVNMAVNARDAMPEGGTLSIEAKVEEVAAGREGGLEPGRYVRLSVADTGHGMDAETAARAAEPFYTTKGVGKGTGLGLSMVHGLAEQSGGRMNIRSRPGEGAVIELWLREAIRHDRDATAPPSEQEPAPGETPPLKVLVVDDDGLVLMNTVAMVEDLGHTAIEAASAAEALQIVERRPVDLVISDYAMPHMTGAQLAEGVAALRPDLPIILATGYAELPSGGLALPQLAKPFSMSDLAKAIAAVICERPAAAAPERVASS